MKNDWAFESNSESAVRAASALLRAPGASASGTWKGRCSFMRKS